MDMRNRKFVIRGFTLVELLVVLAIITALSSLFLAALNRVKSKASQASCLNNLKQINVALRMYADDFRDRVAAPSGTRSTVESWYRFRELAASYLRRPAPSRRHDSLFACPADTFFYSVSGYHAQGLCEMPRTGYCSYVFNAGNLIGANGYPGIAGNSLLAVQEPSRTVLVCESAAFTPFSWHYPQRTSLDYRFKDSRNMLSFVDGHVRYTSMYWGGLGEAWQYDPPATYDYKWSGR